jgi:guanine deaminase
MRKQSFILKGDICFSKNKDEIKNIHDGYVVCVDGISQGAYKKLPEEYKDLELIDYSGKLILPGLVDLHVHAPQFSYRGLGMDLELIDWLNTYTFPQEAKYEDVNYAKNMYQRFVDDVKRGPNTRSVVFATLHVESTIELMDIFEKSGMVSYIGKVNMDRNGSENLQEESANQSAKDTIRWIESIQDRYERTFPIITPRFTPSCSDDLMRQLSIIRKKYNLKVQSHLSENQGEIKWVSELCPYTQFYGQSYSKFNMFGGDCPTVMAHCVWSCEEEQKLMKKQGVFIAHCPDSNTNLSSGIAPVRKYINDNQNIGLGSDVAGGTHTSIFKAMADAISVSKLRWRLVDQNYAPITVAEAFYLGTIGGGKFFGKVGSFESGYEFDAIVVDDSRYTVQNQWDDLQRLEKTIYLSNDFDVIHKYVQGRKLF